MNKNRNEFEIMAPVGSRESLAAAIHAGADSVYFGIGKLNMRSHSANHFTVDDLKEIAGTCKAQGIKTYLTVNTVIYGEDIETMHCIIDAAKAAGITAVIASDVAVMMYCRQAGVEVHLSCGPMGQPVRIEMFCHGALCMAISGKCYMSLHDANRSANRGECVQICRRSYTVTDNETGNQLEIDNKYIMSPKDLKTVRFIDRMMDAGVRVFKIEGRARGPEYVHTVVTCYREAIESVLDGTFTEAKKDQWDERLSTVFNRGFWDGYYQGKKMGEWTREYGNKATEKKVLIGKVMKYFSRLGVAEIAVEANTFAKGDKLLVTGNTTGAMFLHADEIRYDLKPVEVAEQGWRVSIPVPDKVRPNDKLFKLIRN